MLWLLMLHAPCILCMLSMLSMHEVSIPTAAPSLLKPDEATPASATGAGRSPGKQQQHSNAAVTVSYRYRAGSTIEEPLKRRPLSALGGALPTQPAHPLQHPRPPPPPRLSSCLHPPPPAPPQPSWAPALCGAPQQQPGGV